MTTRKTRKTRQPDEGVAGLGIDDSRLASVDPTRNVLDLVGASNLRQDDLRDLIKELHGARLDHIREISEIRSDCLKETSELREIHAESLRKAESERLNSIRQVDREDVNKTAAAAQMAIAALATNTSTLAETLRNQVAAVAAAAETRRTADNQEITKRLSALELTYSEGKGKQTLADPRLDRLIETVERLQIGSSRGEGAGNQAAMNKADSQFDMTKLIAVVVAVAAVAALAMQYFGGN